MNKLRNLITGIVAGFAGMVLTQPTLAEITVSGSFTQTVAFGEFVGGLSVIEYTADNTSTPANEEKTVKTDSVHFHTDAEVHFTGSGVTDGGLKVQARVELEGASESDQIDEQWISVEGNFGKVTLGGNDPAIAEHGNVGIAGGYGALGYYDGTDTYTPAGAFGPGGSNDGQSIRYSTPTIGGFSAGVSYHPDTREVSDLSAKTGSLYRNVSAHSVGASYASSMGTINFTIGGGVLASDVRGHDKWGLGTELGFGSTVLYLRTDRASETHLAARSAPCTRQQRNSRQCPTRAFEDTTNYAIGVEHTVGPATFGIGYAQQKEAKKVRITRTPTTGTRTHSVEDSKATTLVAGAKYNLGGGASVGLAVAWGEVENHLNRTSGEDPDADGTAIGAHIALSF